jgi:hypothetical protein
MGTIAVPPISASSSAGVQRRQFYRLHASTWVLLAPIVALLVVLIVPAEIETGGTDYNFDHGWPWRYLRRVVTTELSVDKLRDKVLAAAQPDELPPGTPSRDVASAMYNSHYPNGYPGWCWRSAWVGSVEKYDWNPTAIVGDIVVAGLMLVSVAALLEWRRRRHARAWQFSLGELGLAIACLAAALGWWNVHARHAQREVAFQEYLFDAYGTRKTQGVSYTKLPPSWYRRLVGPGHMEPFSRATELFFPDWKFDHFRAEFPPLPFVTSVVVNKVSNAQSLADWLTQLPSLEFVGITVANAADLEILCKSGELVELEISFGHKQGVIDAALAHLRHSPKLNSIDLSRSLITDDAVRYLVQLPNLKYLDLSETKITDEGVKQLCSLTNLKSLELRSTEITDEALRHVARMKGLEWLSFDSPSITADGLAHLSSLQNLFWLDIPLRNVNEEGRKHLRRIKSLRHPDIE